jgi:uncharacterized protein YpmB
MEPNTNSNGMLNGLPLTPKEGNKIGPIIGALVIIILVVVAAIYFFGRNLNSDTTPVQEQTVETTDTENGAAAIEAELDAELENIDYSF